MGGITHLYVNNNRNDRESSNMIYILLLTPGGGYSWEFLVGVCRPVLRILTLFQTKKMSFFYTRLQTRYLKSIPIFSRLALFILFQALR